MHMNRHGSALIKPVENHIPGVSRFRDEREHLASSLFSETVKAQDNTHHDHRMPLATPLTKLLGIRVLVTLFRVGANYLTNALFRPIVQGGMQWYVSSITNLRTWVSGAKGSVYPSLQQRYLRPVVLVRINGTASKTSAIHFSPRYTYCVDATISGCTPVRDTGNSQVDV